jgi:hypothetical protein
VRHLLASCSHPARILRAPRLTARRSLHRTTFVRQATNLWRLKELVWQDSLERLPHDAALAIADSFLAPVCQFARAHRRRRLRGEAHLA